MNYFTNILYYCKINVNYKKRGIYVLKSKKMKFLATLLIVGTISTGVVASATPITSKGIKDYHGAASNEAYGWTGTASGKFAKVIVKIQTPYLGWKVLGQATGNNGWAQTRQKIYPSDCWILNGEHYSDTDYASTW